MIYENEFKNIEELNKLLDMYCRDGVVNVGGDHLIGSKLWIPYDRQFIPYEKLTVEERRYYLLLLMIAKNKTTMSYNSRPEVIESLHNFFTDLCNYYNKIYKEGVEKLKTSFMALKIPAVSTTLTRVTYGGGGIYIEYLNNKTNSPHVFYITNVINIINPEFVSKEITKDLEDKLEELDSDPDKEHATELRARILEFILTSDLICG